jgi:exodeoxyribonuclease-1
MQTYLFYDIETTGLNKAFDQVLQFAAIRTDLNLQEIERYELNIKLNPDTIPAPRAIITSRRQRIRCYSSNSSMDEYTRDDQCRLQHARI